MTKDQLLIEISQTLEKKKAEKLAAIAGKSHESVKGVIDLTFSKDNSIAFRAAWILESVFEFLTKVKTENLTDFLEAYPKQKNNSCRRHYTKIMMAMTDQKNAIEFLQNHNWEPVLESTFEWLTEHDCPVAVRVNCLDILYNLKDKENWITDELVSQISFLLKNGSAAMQSRGKKLMKKLGVK